MIDGRRALGALIAGLGLAGAATAAKPAPAPAVEAAAPAAPTNVPELVHPAYRDAVARVLRQPTIVAQGSSGQVDCSPELYGWMLDHPDRVALAWKRLRVPCVEIADVGNGRFKWVDENGSEVIWQAVGRFGGGLVWYASGKVKPAAALPTVPVKAVAVLTHAPRANAKGEAVMVPTAKVYLSTDSRAANLVLRMVGPTAPKMAEQGTEQLLFFFNGIGNYVSKHPEKAEALFAPAK